MDRARLAELRKKKSEAKAKAQEELLKAQDAIKNALSAGFNLPEFNGYEIKYSGDNPIEVKYFLDDKLQATLTLKYDGDNLISAKLA